MNNIAYEQAEKTRAFPLGPDSLALFPGRDYRRALEGLSEDLRRGCRLLCLVGPAGIGKSMVLRSLRGRLQRGFVGEISQPPLGGLLSRLADGIGAASADEAEVLKRLRDMSAAGSRPERLPIVQIIDDAETLSRADLVLVWRLFQAVQGQVLLVGQPEMLELFSGEDGAVSPPDRVYHLEPLSADEVGAYIRHRLNEAGLDRGLFEPEAAAAVSEYSGGVPRLINLLCFAVLAGASFDHETPVTAERVHEAARQRAHNGGYPFVRPPPAPRAEPAPPPENIALVVEDGWQRAPAPASAEAGFARTLWIMIAGVLLGVAAARLPFSEDLNANSLSRTASSVSASAGQTLQRMGSALGDMQASLTAWFSGASPREPAPNVASFEETPPAAEHDVVPAAAAPPAPPAKPAVHAAKEEKPAAAARDGDSEQSRLTLTQRRHLAQLYSERAQYEINSGRWADARISVQRGLQLAPDDAVLQGLDHSVRAESDRQQAALPAAEVAPAEPAQPKPDKEKITQLYLQRAEYEWQNGRLQDALVSINYGLEEDPGNSPLLDMRRRVLEDLAAQR